MIESIVNLLLVVGGIPYLTVIIWLWLGLKRENISVGSHVLSVSVIIAARNEEKYIEKCVNSLKGQNYEGEWELIVVDDRSCDNTLGILCDIRRYWSKLHIVAAHNPPKLFCPKKNALAAGIEIAKGEILLFTDADCEVPSNWIASMVSYFTEDTGFVAGYAKVSPSASMGILHHLLSIENLAMGALAIGSFAHGKPLSCTGRNLGYRKSVYDEVGGFAECGHLVGGDDVYMMRNIRRLTNWRMCFNRDSIVNSKPVPLKILSVINQKIRHAAKGVNYNGPAFLLGILIYLYHWGILAGILQSFFTDSVSVLWIYFCCARFVVDFLLLKRMSAIEKVRSLSILPFLELLYIPYVCFFPVAARLGLFTWKK